MERAKKLVDRPRRRTPWDGIAELTPTQAFLQEHYVAHYEEKHMRLIESGEAAMINSYQPENCPFCSATDFQRYGHTANDIQRYKCACGRTFLPTTNTIFDDRKISVSEWIEYCLNLFRHLSINAGSWNNKNSFTTSRYWLAKLFATLSCSQNDIVLSGRVWFDETFYPVIKRDVERRPDGDRLHGISRDQLCIGVATDKERVVCILEGTGRPSQKRTYEAFKGHIQRGACLIHDKDSAHKKLVKELELESEEYRSKDVRHMLDRDNPLEPVNRVHALLKVFLNSHSGFSRNDIQGYLDLFAFVMNPPKDRLEKIENLINWAFRHPKLLRYRDMYQRIPRDEK